MSGVTGSVNTLCHFGFLFLFLGWKFFFSLLYQREFTLLMSSPIHVSCEDYFFYVWNLNKMLCLCQYSVYDHNLVLIKCITMNFQQNLETSQPKHKKARHTWGNRPQYCGKHCHVQAVKLLLNIQIRPVKDCSVAICQSKTESLSACCGISTLNAEIRKGQSWMADVLFSQLLTHPVNV